MVTTRCTASHVVSATGFPNGSATASASIIGREGELAEVGELLSDKSVRLLTLTGGGGVGKTMLAEASLERLEPGTQEMVLMADLAGARDEEGLAACLATALDVPSEPSDTDWLQRTASHLGDRDILLLLDNCEHALTPLRRAADTLLSSCPGLRLLATSRVRLHLEGERALRVDPLVVPDSSVSDPEELAEVPSVRLFLTRARAARPEFGMATEAVAELCRMVDGLPLAIEIAAARAKLFEPELLGAHLRTNLDMLCGRAGDTRSRFSCLRECLTASMELLDAEEREALLRLAVFASDFDLEGAEALLEMPASRVPVVIEGLVEKSLLTVRGLDGQGASDPLSRFSMPGTTRMYALELLEPDLYFDLLERHARYYQELVSRRAGQGRNLQPAELEQERENLQAALRHFASTNQHDRAAQLGISLSWYWLSTGAPERGLSYLDTLLTEELPESFRARFLEYACPLTAAGDTPAEAVAICETEAAGVCEAEADGLPDVGGADVIVDVSSLHDARSASSALASLTRREAEVASLVARGLTNRAISRELGIAEWTTVNHVRNIMRKLECSSRVSIASVVSFDAAHTDMTPEADPA